MDTKEFEEAIEPFAKKIVNPDNGLVKYEITFRKKTNLFNRFETSTMNAKKVVVYNGVEYESISAAAKNLGLTTAFVSKSSTDKRNGFKFKGDDL